MRGIVLAVALFAAASLAAAQAPDDRPAGPAVELRPFVGVYVPTGGMHQVMKGAPLFGTQVAYELRPSLHLLGAFTWIPSTDKLHVSNTAVTILQSDVGVEVARVRRTSGGWEIKPFLGAGAGARTYRYGSPRLADATCAAGYGALGVEFQWGATALRLEARDYLYCFESPVAGGKTRTRSDVGLSAGVAFHF